MKMQSAGDPGTHNSRAPNAHPNIRKPAELGTSVVVVGDQASRDWGQGSDGGSPWVKHAHWVRFPSCAERSPPMAFVGLLETAPVLLVQQDLSSAVQHQAHRSPPLPLPECGSRKRQRKLREHHLRC